MDLPELLADSLGQVNVGVWDLQLATNDVSWTTQIEQIYGFSPAELSASFEAAAQRVQPEDRAAWAEDVRACFWDGKRHDLTFRILTKGGEVRWTHAVGQCRQLKPSARRLNGNPA